jgi:hypothetical protein
MEKPKTEAKDKPANSIIYVGKDQGYWSNIKKQLKQSYNIIFIYKEFYTESDTKIQNFFIDVYHSKPNIIIIDFTTNLEEHLHLARLLSRTSASKKIVTVGLVDNLMPKHKVELCLQAGASAVYEKSGELDNLIYGMIYLAYPDSIKEHGYATAPLSDNIVAYELCKVGQFSKESIHFESNLEFKIGDLVEVSTYWYDQKILKSARLTIAEHFSSNLFYEYIHGYEGGFKFVPRPEISPDADEDVVAEKEEKYEEDLAITQEVVGLWFDSNAQISRPKFVKCLVIDKEFAILRDQIRTDKHPFILRTQPFLQNIKDELAKIYPQIIAFNLEEVTKETLEANPDLAHTYNDSRTMKAIIKAIRDLKNYEPYFIVFNAKNFTTEQIKKFLNYDKLLIHDNSLEPSIFLKMAEALHKKIQSQEANKESEYLYIEKHAPQAIAEFKHEITILQCSENDLYLASERPLKPYTNLRLVFPIDMYITIVPTPATPAIPNAYYALITCIGEKEKQDLRKFINSVFFREKDLQKQQELEEFKNKQEAALKQMQDEAEAAKKAKEEKAKEEKGD